MQICDKCKSEITGDMYWRESLGIVFDYLGVKNKDSWNLCYPCWSELMEEVKPILMKYGVKIR